MKEVWKRIREVIASGKTYSRKGAYSWALLRYAQAAAMGDSLVRLQMGGGISMTPEELSELQAMMMEVRTLVDGVRLKLGNGHGLSGKRQEWPLSDLADVLISEMDAIFFS